MNTPGDKQGAASAGAVDDVDRIVLMKVHFRFSIDAMTALVRTGEVPRCYGHLATTPTGQRQFIMSGIRKGHGTVP
ncbi:hypothetical protein HMPREF9540_00480, partial [Escherichia coli MS 115-1]